MENFLNDAILSETTALSGTEQELRGFHRRIGSNLSLIEPTVKSPDVHRDARASKVRAAESPSRRGGHAKGQVNLATRDSIQDNSGRQAGSITPSSPATSPNSQSRDAESHDSASRKISVSAELRRDKSVKKSSSRWADRPVPVLQVEFPNPWRILANSPKNLKWSGWWDLNPRLLRPERSALPGCATPRFGEQKGNIAGGGRVSKPNRQGARPLAGLRIESASDLKKWAVVDVCRGKG